MKFNPFRSSIDRPTSQARQNAENPQVRGEAVVAALRSGKMLTGQQKATVSELIATLDARTGDRAAHYKLAEHILASSGSKMPPALQKELRRAAEQMYLSLAAERQAAASAKDQVAPVLPNDAAVSAAPLQRAMAIPSPVAAEPSVQKPADFKTTWRDLPRDLQSLVTDKGDVQTHVNLRALRLGDASLLANVLHRHRADYARLCGAEGAAGLAYARAKIDPHVPILAGRLQAAQQNGNAGLNLRGCRAPVRAATGSLPTVTHIDGSQSFVGGLDWLAATPNVQTLILDHATVGTMSIETARNLKALRELSISGAHDVQGHALSEVPEWVRHIPGPLTVKLSHPTRRDEAEEGTLTLQHDHIPGAQALIEFR